MERKLSKQIEMFLNMLTECRNKHIANSDIVEQCRKNTTDYLHSLELEKMTSSERAKLTTRQKKNLQTRRKSKDIVELNEPIVNWLNSEETKKVKHALTKVLGDIRKIENYHKERIYKYRNKKIVEIKEEQTYDLDDMIEKFNNKQ